MKINLIAAMTYDGVIGTGDRLPWTRQRSDMRRFAALTRDCPVLVGHKTYESLRSYAKDRNNPLPGRPKVVYSTKIVDVTLDTIKVQGTPEQIIDRLRFHFPDRTLWVIGGGKVYDTFMPFCDRLYLTKVQLPTISSSSDPTVVRFPFSPYPKRRVINGFAYEVIEDEIHEPDEDNEFRYHYITYEKVIQNG